MRLILEVWMSLLMDGWNRKNGFLASKTSDGENWIPGRTTGLNDGTGVRFGMQVLMRCW